MWTTLKAVTEKKLNVEQTEAYIANLTDKTVKPKKNVIKIFKDVRIFVNTFNKAIATMKEAGINAESDKTETDEYIEYRVRIPKEAHNQAHLSLKSV